MEKKNICGVCAGTFETEEAYATHVCKDGKKPTDPEHLGPEFALVSEAALERGKERKEEKDGK